MCLEVWSEGERKQEANDYIFCCLNVLKLSKKVLPFVWMLIWKERK